MLRAATFVLYISTTNRGGGTAEWRINQVRRLRTVASPHTEARGGARHIGKGDEVTTSKDEDRGETTPYPSPGQFARGYFHELS